MKRFFLFTCFLAFMVETFSQSVKFAIISDLHPDIMFDTEKRLNDFLSAAQKAQVDFIIDLGDFAMVKEKNRKIVNLWNTFSGDKHHVIGNHDTDNCTKEEYMLFVGMPRRYYSFDKGGMHFIILDPNNLYVDEKYIPYAHGNYFVKSTFRDYIDSEQIEWLKDDLSKTDKRCVIFSHQSLENTIQNRELVRKILESENARVGYKKVVAAFSGHDHTNYEKVINGIAYIQINSASDQWVDKTYECKTRFSEDLYQEYPSLKYVMPWEDCLYAIVEINKKGLELKGKESKFIPPTPDDLQIPDDYLSVPLVSYIKDFSFLF